MQLTGLGILPPTMENRMAKQTEKQVPYAPLVHGTCNHNMPIHLGPYSSQQPLSVLSSKFIWFPFGNESLDPKPQTA